MVRIETNEIQSFETEHLAALRALAPECMVLLKKNGDFPLCAPCEIALYGSGARETIKGGTGSGDVNVRHYVTVEEGLEKAGFTITTKAWMDGYKAAKDNAAKAFLEEIKQEAEALGKPAILVGMGRTPKEPRYELPLDGEGEVCLYVLARNSGEGSDRKAELGDLCLTEDETRDILLCADKYEKFLLVLNVGGPVDLTPVLDKVENVLLLSQLGSVTGDALADVLLGKAYPSGKLTATWAKAEDYPTIGDFGTLDDARYREGVFVGYRYFDAAGVEPLFPFGYGLGYTDFAVRATGFSVENNAAVVMAAVQNIGKFAGKETVQLYYSAPDGKLKKPLRELGTYQKTDELLPGESETITLTLPLENMASWDAENDCWLLEKGNYVLFLGSDPVGVIALDASARSASLSHAGGEADFADWTPSTVRTALTNIKRIAVEASSLNGFDHFERERTPYDRFDPVDLSAFTDRELATVCAGKHTEGQVSSFIGNAAARLAGGAGESADVVTEKGFGAILMADGPAGLRIATKYVETENGQEGLDAGGLDNYIALLPDYLQQLIHAQQAKREELRKTHPILYHYASAIPIGTALAQAWNPKVPEACGELVGTEMELFGANVWLAPALNIQRSPLCGRNFEYYSEDPIISGLTAAAVTRGVQKHKKCAVTIKHFACNNQEYNRFGSNSIVSQRALREIYLKGFELCIKTAAPKTIMSSYNLLNGMHTANRHDLLTDILRKDWGFGGFVMTDWGTTSDGFNLGAHGCSSAEACIAAGNDLVMPGTEADVNGMLEGLANGTITRAELETSAARILTMARSLS
ncbi:MAG: glycoside hydrolase family 3 C-terminal domain-containing protein [Clostridia bacterium]|nr:glycoside hydrolase family 3 C-terminal domain-containing protein [Clostridia bacterium]